MNESTEGGGTTDAWEVLRALEDLLCDFGWVGGRQVNKCSRTKGSREKGKNQADL